METYRHVAVAVEDSPGSRKALDEAWRMASLSGARLSVLHVTSIPLPPPYMGEGGVFLPDPQVMQDAALVWLKEMVEGIPGAEPQVLEGHPPDAVCEWAGANDVDLLVAGAERGRVERLLLGSFALHLARHAPCDILLARPEKK
ncbi:MAG: universal stress protein [Thermoleophilia bacterium]|nr:universal stress protein [Thermoleophilia bacterium]